MPALDRLVERFGPEILRPDGSLDRPALAGIAFVNDETRKELEAITHPAIGELFLQRVAEAPAGSVVVHDVPLLVESKRGFEYAAVIVVEAPLEVRLDRLEARGVPRDDARRRIELQASDDDRRRVATWIVDNSGDLAALDRRIDDIWTELARMAAEKTAAEAASGPEGAASPPESRA